MFISEMFGDTNFGLASFTTCILDSFSSIWIYRFTNTDGHRLNWFETILLKYAPAHLCLAQKGWWNWLQPEIVPLRITRLSSWVISGKKFSSFKNLHRSFLKFLLPKVAYKCVIQTICEKVKSHVWERKILGFKRHFLSYSFHC